MAWGSPGWQHFFVMLGKKSTVWEKAEAGGVLGVRSPAADSCFVAGKLSSAHPADSPEVGSGQALVNPLPAARLYNPLVPPVTAPKGARCRRHGPAAPCPPLHPAPHQHRLRAGHRALPRRPGVSGQGVQKPAFWLIFPFLLEELKAGLGEERVKIVVGGLRRVGSPGALGL